MRMIVGVDSQFVHRARKDANIEAFYPYKALRDYLEKDGDVLEMFATVIRFPADLGDDADMLKRYRDYQKNAEALEWQGLAVIECVAKKTLDGDIKHSDDNQLMIRLALACTRLKPDVLVLVAADGDYAPLVWGLREEGIRTRLVTDLQSSPSPVANELKRAVYRVEDMWDLAEKAVDWVEARK